MCKEEREREERRDVVCCSLACVCWFWQEATYGTHITEKRDVREARFTGEMDTHSLASSIPLFLSLSPFSLSLSFSPIKFGVAVPFSARVHDIVSRGGRCLIPVFALGRAQELLLILDEYWAAHPELHDIPIYYVSALAKRCMAGE